MSERMNPKVKAQWLTALRSGDYPQARNTLHYVDDSGQEHFCCLAVLADLYQQDQGGHWSAGDGDDKFDDGKGGYADGSCLSDAIQKWAGAEVDTFNGFTDYGTATLPLLNDDEKLDFPEIADLIEEHL